MAFRREFRRLTRWPRCCHKQPLRSAFVLRLEDLTKGARVRGVTPTGPVTVIGADWIGAGALTLTYEDGSGITDREILYRANEAHKMSASFQGTEVRETKRYRLGRQLEQVVGLIRRLPRKLSWSSLIRSDRLREDPRGSDHGDQRV